MSAPKENETPVVRVPLAVQIIAPVPASEMTDVELAASAADAVDRALALRADSIEQARRAGELLLEAQHRCQDRDISFRSWCARYWSKSHTTALTYIKVATEVPQNLVGAPTNVLDLQSVRAFLVDRGHSAGGTREKESETETEDETLARVGTPEPKADAPEKRERPESRGPVTPRGVPAPPAHQSPGDMATKLDAAAERASIEAARNRDPLAPFRDPPPPPPVEAVDDVEPVCVASDIREAFDAIVAAQRAYALAASGLLNITLHDVPGAEERDELWAQLRAAVEGSAASVGSVAKKWARAAQQVANLDASVVGAAKEAHAKAAKRAARRVS